MYLRLVTVCVKPPADIVVTIVVAILEYTLKI